MRIRIVSLARKMGLLLGVLLSLLVSASCTPAGAGISLAPAAHANDPTSTALPLATITPLPSATAFPTAAAVTGTAGWQTVTSEHWVGYTFPQTNVTGLRAQWIEPAATGAAGDEEFVWIGVGGWNYTGNNIIQVGTFVYLPPSGGLNQGVWYEAVPQDPYAQYPLLPVKPGDQVFASITQVKASPQTWEMLLVDGTTGVTFTKTMEFTSLHAYPSFVVEAPNHGPASPYGPFYPLPNWGHVTFTQMQIRVGSEWQSAASFYGYRVNMVRDGKTLATAGPLSASSSFTATQR